jgi:hypothetical protein
MHVLKKHPGMPCYSGTPDLEKYGWKAQRKDWEV